MATTTKIQTIIDKQGNVILPRTRIEAVYLEDGVTTIQDRLDAIDSQLSEGADLSSVDESILPSLDITYDLGSPSKRWKDLYLSDASLYIGNVKISTTNNEIKFDDVNTGNPIPFGSNYTPKATATTIGAIKPGAGFNVDGNGILTISTATTSSAGSMSAADKTKLDGIAANANNYSLPTATSTVKGGIELFSDTVQSIAANSVSAIDNRTYGIQLNSNGQAVVNVPWEGSSATYIAGNGLGLSGTTFSLDTPSTLTAATSNGVTADSHTHAITTTISGAASTIVATDASGNITAADTLNLGTAADIKYNANTKSIDFIFA